jgi:hypothetical protein
MVVSRIYVYNVLTTNKDILGDIELRLRPQFACCAQRLVFYLFVTVS